MKYFLIILVSLFNVHSATYIGLQADTNGNTVFPSGVLKQTNHTLVATTKLDGKVTSTGSTTGRNLSDRFSDIVNVKDFGAIGDGSTDCTESFSNLVAAATSGATVWVPEGTFILGELRVNKNLKFAGPGTIKRKTGSSRSTIIIGAEGDEATLDGANGGTEAVKVRFEGLTFDGNKANNAAADLAAFIHYGAMVYLVNGYKSADFHKCVFTNTTRTAIYASGPLTVENCEFHDMATHTGTLNENPFTIIGLPTTDNNPATPLSMGVYHSLLKTSTNLTTLKSNAGGIFLTENEGVKFDSATISFNKFYGIGQALASNELGAIDTYNGVGSLVVDGNEIYDTVYAGVKAQRAANARIVNNVIKRVHAGGSGFEAFGILYDPMARDGSSPFTGARSNEWGGGNAVISGNIIDDWEYAAIQVSNDGDHVIIDRNIITNGVAGRNNLCRGVYVAGGSDNVSVTYNKISEMTGEAIYFTGGGNQEVSFNFIGAHSVSNQSTGITFGNGVTNSTIANNTVILNSTNLANIFVTAATNITIRYNEVIGGYNGIRISGNSQNVASEWNRIWNTDSTGWYNDSANNVRSTGDNLNGADPVWTGDVDGGTIDADTTIRLLRGAASADLILRSDNGQNARVYFQNGVTNMFATGKRSSDSYYTVNRYDTSGALADAPMEIPTYSGPVRFTAGIRASTVTINPSAYGVGWSGSTNAAAQGDIYTQMETKQAASTAIIAGDTFSGDVTGTLDADGDTVLTITPGLFVSNTAFDVSWNGVTTIAPSKNAIYDEIVNRQPLDSDLTLIAGTNPGNNYYYGTDGTGTKGFHALPAAQVYHTTIGCGDLTTALTAGGNKGYWRAPTNITIVDIRASLLTGSSAGNVVVDVHASGTTIMTTDKLTIEASETSTETAATQPALTDTSLTNDELVVVEVDSEGANAAGLQVRIYYTMP